MAANEEYTGDIQLIGGTQALITLSGRIGHAVSEKACGLVDRFVVGQLFTADGTL